MFKPAVFVAALVLALPVPAADAPQRKSGLWEMQTRMTGMPGPAPGPMQMCVDRATDNVMQERAKEQANCPVMNVSRSAGKITIHAVCKSDGVTTTSDAVITGDFDSAYRNEMTIRYEPPQQGTKEMKMVQEARWLGPCKPGQKAGDVMMPGMQRFNMPELMNDPQMREMMKRQQGR